MTTVTKKVLCPPRPCEHSRKALYTTGGDAQALRAACRFCSHLAYGVNEAISHEVLAGGALDGYRACS